MAIKSQSMSPVGALIVAVGQRHGMTRYRIAKNAGIDHSQFHRMMRGTPSRDNLLKICRSLRCSLEEANEIFKETDYRAPTLEELEEEPVAA